jgi:hypothetical protein
MATGIEQPAFFAHFSPPYGSSNKTGPRAHRQISMQKYKKSVIRLAPHSLHKLFFYFIYTGSKNEF